MSERKKITEESGEHKAWAQEAKNQTMESLPAFMSKLADGYEHDYGTICHALSAAAVGAASALNNSAQGGITGFQAGCVMWGFIQTWMNYQDTPLLLMNMNDMLYPQYENKFRTISAETWGHLQKKAAENLSAIGGHEAVRDHWASIVAGRVPFGFRVEE